MCNCMVSGVSQGSVLEPLLFLVYTRELALSSGWLRTLLKLTQMTRRVDSQAILRSPNDRVSTVASRNREYRDLYRQRPLVCSVGYACKYLKDEGYACLNHAL